MNCMIICSGVLAIWSPDCICASSSCASPKLLPPCPLRARFCRMPSMPFDAAILLESTARLIHGRKEFTPPVRSASRKFEPREDMSGCAIFHADVPILASGPAQGELLEVELVLLP